MTTTTPLDLYAANVGTQLSDISSFHTDLDIIDNPVIWAFVEKHLISAFINGAEPCYLALLAIEAAFPDTVEWASEPDYIAKAIFQTGCIKGQLEEALPRAMLHLTR